MSNLGNQCEYNIDYIVIRKPFKLITEREYTRDELKLLLEHLEQSPVKINNYNMTVERYIRSN